MVGMLVRVERVLFVVALCAGIVRLSALLFPDDLGGQLAVGFLCVVAAGALWGIYQRLRQAAR